MCVCIHTYVHAYSSHAYVYLWHAHAYPDYAHVARVPGLYKRKAFAHKFVWNESHIVWEQPQTPILPLYKSIKILKEGEYMQDSLENSESKREFS